MLRNYHVNIRVICNNWVFNELARSENTHSVAAEEGCINRIDLGQNGSSCIIWYLNPLPPEIYLLFWHYSPVLGHAYSWAIPTTSPLAPPNHMAIFNGSAVSVG